MPKGYTGFSLTIEYYREEDGRWLADIAALPGGWLPMDGADCKPRRPFRRWRCD